MRIRVLLWLLLCSAKVPAFASIRVHHAFVSTTNVDVPPSTNATISNGPPAGAVYQKALQLPVLGRQSFQLSVLQDGRAHLRVDGAMKIDEIMDYQVLPCGRFSTCLPDRLQRILRRFRTQLVDFGYDRVNDLPYVVVSPPLSAKIHLYLARDPRKRPISTVRSIM